MDSASEGVISGDAAEHTAQCGGSACGNPWDSDIYTSRVRDINTKGNVTWTIDNSRK
jgi:hypothetical protein